MNINQKTLIVSLALLAGFIGGFISNQLFITKSAFAEKMSKAQKVIVAEMFKIVNKKGQVCGSIEGYEHWGKPGALLALGNDDYVVRLGASVEGAHLFLKTNKTIIDINTWNGMDSSQDHASIKLYASKKGLFDEPDIEIWTDRGTYIKLADYKGNMRTVIGNAETVTPKTGVAHKHPISSIVLFSEKGNVLWSAP